MASDEPSSTTTISNGRSASAAVVASAELGGEPFLVEHRRHHAEQAQLAGGHDRPECRAPLRSGGRDARPREHPPAAGRLLRGDPQVLPRHGGARVGLVDRRADAAGAGDPAAGHLQVVEVDDPAAAARAADEGAADEVQGRPAAHPAGDDEVLSGEPGQPVRVLPPDGRAAAGLPVALLHAAHRPAARHLPGRQPARHGAPAAVRREPRVELPLHPGPDGARRRAACSWS